jgi:putative transposase
MKFAFMQAEKATFPIGFMCRQFGVSRSGFYAWRSRKPSKRAQNDVDLTKKIRRVHEGSRRTYGSPRVRAALAAEGAHHSRKRVMKLMRQEGLQGRKPKAFHRTTDSRHAFPIAPNLLARKFEVASPNTAWVTDITYVATLEGWLYLAAIIDLFSRKVVGWAMSEGMERQLCLSALDMALKARQPPPGLIHHSDRGSQYASTEYRRMLDAHGLLCSMSRKGDCWDNAVAESFWSTLKSELIQQTTFATRAEARRAIFEFIEVFYNRQRIHSHLDYRTPVEHESLASSIPLAA